MYLSQMAVSYRFLDWTHQQLLVTPAETLDKSTGRSEILLTSPTLVLLEQADRAAPRMANRSDIR